MKLRFFVFYLIISLKSFAFDEIKSDSSKFKTPHYFLTFSGLYLPNQSSAFLSFGLALEKPTQNKRLTTIGSFYNTYNNHFKNGGHSAQRFTSLTYGFNYNLLKKHKLNLGLQLGFFLYDSYLYFQGTQHDYGITLSPQFEYRYCFKKFEIGIDMTYFGQFGKFQTPGSALFFPEKNQISYETKLDLNMRGYPSLKFTKKLF